MYKHPKLDKTRTNFGDRGKLRVDKGEGQLGGTGETAGCEFKQGLFGSESISIYWNGLVRSV